MQQKPTQPPFDSLIERTVSELSTCFHHFGCNADRADASEGANCKRVDSGFAYPRRTNSLAQQEQTPFTLKSQ